MKKTHLLTALILGLAAPAVWAADSASTPHLTNLEAALTDCAAKVKKDSEGMPDQKAMEACMKAKGFSGPEATPTKSATKPQ